MSDRRRVLVATVGRSDYGIYRPVLRALGEHPRLEPSLVVSGAHLNGPEPTRAEIDQDGWPIAAEIATRRTGGAATDVGAAMGEILAGATHALVEHRPDILLVLGDRFEMFAIAAAAVPLDVPIGHIHGGELSFGAIDEVFRHAITKMAHLHFVATAEYGRRVEQMGEEPWRVVVSGAPALDTALHRALPDRATLEARFGLDLAEPPILVAYHPVTRVASDGAAQLRDVLAVLAASDRPLVITGPNADAGADALRDEIARFVSATPRARFVESFGSEAYLAMLREAACLVGNSSSGIIETPSFELPTVNIGLRQAGRTRAPNVIDCAPSREEIASALTRALDPAFRQSLQGMRSPYGEGRAGAVIAHTLAEQALDERLLRKLFVDIRTAR